MRWGCCENRRQQSVIQLVSSFCKAILEQDENLLWWKVSVAQFGEEERTLFVKLIIEGVFVRQCDQTRIISHITKSGWARGKSWTRQILGDAWNRWLWKQNWQEKVLWSTFWNFWKLIVENSTSFLRILKLTDTWEFVPDTRGVLTAIPDSCEVSLFMNSESESEGSFREPWQEKPGWSEAWQEKPGWKPTRTESQDSREGNFDK